MKSLCFLLAIILVGCVNTGEKIPLSWITGEATIEDIHDHYHSLCLSLQKRKVLIDGEYHPINIECERGTGNPFKRKLKPEFRVYRYNSPKEYWEGLSGSKGFLLEVNGEIVDYISTTVN